MGKSNEKKQRQKAKPKVAPVPGAAKREVHVKAFEQRCTSPRGVRTFVHRTDVIGGNLAEAQESSNAFVEKYKKQGWGVQVRALTV